MCFSLVPFQPSAVSPVSSNLRKMRTGDVHAEGPLRGGRGRLLVRIVQRRHRGFLETGKKSGRKERGEEGTRERNRISIKFRSQGGRTDAVRPSVLCPMVSSPSLSAAPWSAAPRSVVRHLVSESKVDEGLITRRERERERGSDGNSNSCPPLLFSPLPRTRGAGAGAADPPNF